MMRWRCAVLAEIGTPPERVRLFKAGENTALFSNGKRDTFVVDRDAAQAIMSARGERSQDVLVDYEHQSEGGSYASPDGTSPAAGWIKSFEWIEGDGLWATVDWTPAAAKMISAREYRYLSPVFTVDKGTKRAQRVFSVALTNTPALTDMRPIAANAMGEEFAVQTEITDELGLPRESTLEEVVAAIKEAKNMADNDKPKNDATDKPADYSAVAKALNLPADAAIDTIVAKASEYVTASDKAKATDTDASSKLAKLEADHAKLVASIADRDAEDFVRGGMEAGKIVAGTRELWKDSYLNNAAKARTSLEAAPVVVSMQRKTPDSAAGDGSGKASDEVAKLVEAKITASSGKLARHDAYAAVLRERSDLRQRMVAESNVGKAN
jgi:phage I-like protein